MFLSKYFFLSSTYKYLTKKYRLNRTKGKPYRSSSNFIKIQENQKKHKKKDAAKSPLFFFISSIVS
jgi:hypothetical protein